MKIQCDKKSLLTALINVSRAAPAKSTVPALEGILFEANSDQLKLTAYDQKIGIYTCIDADVSEQGAVIIPARFITDLVRKLPDSAVSITSGANFDTHIRCEKSEFSVMGFDPAEYPELSVVDAIQNISIPEAVLKEMIEQVIFSVSTSDARPLYTGVLFEVGENDLTMVAIDGFRMAKRSETMENANMSPCSFVIPGATLAEVGRICNAGSFDNVIISLGDRHASFSVGSTVIISRRLEGEFMNYKRTIPSTFRYEITVSREDLMKSIDRTSLVIKDKTSQPVKMVVGNGVLDFSCATSFGHAADSCFCEGNGEGLTLGFNDRYMTDALKAASEEKVKLSFNSQTNPIIIQAAEGSKYLYMVLPVRIRSEAE